MSMEIPISRIRIEQRTRRDLGDLQSLAASIKAVGLLHPIVVTDSNVLVVGQRRLEAVRLLGHKTIPVTVINLADPLAAERDENTERKNFVPSELVAISYRIEEVEREKAKKRDQRTQLSGRAPGGKPIIGGVKVPPPKNVGENGTNGKARDHVAAAVGMSHPTLEKARAVVEAAEREPEVYKPLLEEMDRSGNVSGAFKVLQQVEGKPEAKPAAKPSSNGKSFPELTPDQIEKRDAAMRWHAALYKCWFELDAIRKLGGMKAVCKYWREADWQECLADIEHIARTSAKYAAELKELCNARGKK